MVQPWLRFHIPLIEPDVRIARIRLSDKNSRLHPRHVVPKPAQAYESEVPVEVREWIGPAPASPGFVLDAQPPAQPHSGVVVDRSGVAHGVRDACAKAGLKSTVTGAAAIEAWLDNALRRKVD